MLLYDQGAMFKAHQEYRLSFDTDGERLTDPELGEGPSIVRKFIYCSSFETGRVTRGRKTEFFETSKFPNLALRIWHVRLRRPKILCLITNSLSTGSQMSPTK
jgi:hypothetical protein